MHPRTKLVGDPDYTVRVRDDDESMTHMDRRKLWPVAFLVVLVAVVVAWLVLR